MRLRKIRVKNFATYVDAEIDFQKLSYPLFVAGRTGAGKTTLIVDALTAALYGEAYGEGKLIKQAVRIGAPSAYVELEFELDGIVYRVRRTFYTDRKTSSAFLDTYIGSEWRTVAEGNKAVDQEVIKLVKLDYDTMLNSVIVRQGDILNFVQADPYERRNLLLNVFNIHFEAIYSNAKKALESKGQEILKTEMEAEEVKRKIDKEHQLRAEREDACSKLRDLENEKKNLEEAKVEVKRQLEESQSKMAALRARLQIIVEKEKQLNELREQRRKNEKEAEQLKEIISRYPEEKLTKVTDCRNKLDNYWRLKIQLEKLNADKSRLEQQASKMKQLKHIKERLQPLTERDLDNEMRQIKQEISDTDTSIGKLKSKLDMLREYGKIIDRAEAECPVCRQPLETEKKHKLLDHFREEEKQLIRKLQQMNEEAKNLRKKASEVEKDIRNREKLRVMIAELEKDLLDFEESRYLDLSKQTEEINKSIAQLETEIMDFTDVKPEKANEVLDEMDEAARSNERLKEIIVRLEDIKKKEIAIVKDISDRDEVNREIEREGERQKQLRTKHDQIENRVTEIAGKTGKLEQLITQIDSELNEIRQLKDRQKELESKLRDLRLDHTAYSVLTEVFSPSQLPLQLLRDYVELISNYARHYLKVFMPDLDIDLELEPEQRRPERSKIEVNIMSNGYTRPFATYSGGETTLVGFAVRLGIGRALAEILAGTRRPRFLIIDEGFGPLDENLRPKVADALLELYTTGEYEQIIAVSHQPDLKSHPAFQSVLEIQKEDGVSRVEYMQESLSMLLDRE